MFNYISPALGESLLRLLETEVKATLTQMANYREVFSDISLYLGNFNQSDTMFGKGLIGEGSYKQAVAQARYAAESSIKDKTVKYGQSYDGKVFTAPGVSFDYRKGDASTHRAAPAPFDPRDLEPTRQHSPASAQPSNNNMTFNTFNITAFIQTLNGAGDNYDISGVDFPGQDSSLVLDFIDQMRSNDQWNTLKRRKRFAVIYRYIKTLRALSADADLELDVTDPMDALVKKFRLDRISKADFETQMAALVETAEGHIERLENQEEDVANAGSTESLAEQHDRLRRLDAAATTHKSWIALANRLLAEIEGSSMKVGDKKNAKTAVTNNILNPLKAVANYTGHNLRNAILNNGNPTISGRISKAISSLEQVGSGFC